MIDGLTETFVQKIREANIRANRAERQLENLRKIIREIKNEPAHKGFPPSYRYMEGWLDGVNFALGKIEETLEEKEAEKQWCGKQ